MSALEIESRELVSGLGGGAFRVRHHLVGHPLLAADALATLADSLPEREIEHNLGDLPTLLPGGNAERMDLSPGEIVRSIDTNGAWMVLKHIETDPAYGRLLDDLLDEVEPLLAPGESPMWDRAGFIFLSAANAVTPAHFDPEHNLLLQVQGTKTMNVGEWDGISEEQHALEQCFVGGHRNIDTLPARFETIVLEPGDGVHVPLFAPHWVVNGPEPSISLSITFRTAGFTRVERVHSFNAHLRRLGLDPRPPGRSPAVDRAKAAAIAAWEATRGRLRRGGAA